MLRFEMFQHPANLAVGLARMDRLQRQLDRMRLESSQMQERLANPEFEQLFPPREAPRPEPEQDRTEEFVESLVAEAKFRLTESGVRATPEAIRERASEMLSAINDNRWDHMRSGRSEEFPSDLQRQYERERAAFERVYPPRSSDLGKVLPDLPAQRSSWDDAPGGEAGSSFRTVDPPEYDMNDDDEAEPVVMMTGHDWWEDRRASILASDMPADEAQREIAALGPEPPDGNVYLDQVGERITEHALQIDPVDVERATELRHEVGPLTLVNEPEDERDQQLALEL